MQHYKQGWNALPAFKMTDGLDQEIAIDVILPARNEAQNIEACLRSIFKNDYSLYKVWVVDDHSTDETVAVVKRLQQNHANLYLVQLSDELEGGQGKKAAIAAGIQRGSAQLIMTTDADSVVPETWLSIFAKFYQSHQFHCIGAPVNFYQEQNLMERFQSLDYQGMMLITGAGIQRQWMRMANGANLAYSREAYQKVNGFAGIDHLASGDDMLLMQKMAKAYPQGIGFIKNKAATVHTLAQPSWQHFIRQRLRWASKSAVYPEWKVTAALALVFFYCWTIIAALVFGLLYPSRFLPLFFLLFFIKTGVDYAFLKKATQFFERPDLLRNFLLQQILHITYIASVGLLANLVKKYEWKGRMVQ